MRRRLPLAGTPGGPNLAAAPVGDEAAAEVPAWTHLALSAHTLGIADTSSGLVALTFAIELACELRREVPVLIVALDFAGRPDVPARFRAQLAEAQIELVVSEVAHAPTAIPALPQGAPWLQLWVGLPAVVAFRPALSMLLGADRPLAQRPPALRARRVGYALELGESRPGLAQALASALNERGFLPRPR